MFVLKSKYNKLLEANKSQKECIKGTTKTLQMCIFDNEVLEKVVEELKEEILRAKKEIDLCKIANETMQEQLTIEKQRVKDLYIELQLLRNK